MLFNSYTFILFFAIVLGLHYMPLPWRVKKFNLLFASYVFYAAWNPPFVVLLWISTLVDWFAARGIANSDNKLRRRLFVLLSLATNLGLLGFFKYGNFLLLNFVDLAQSVGIHYQPLRMDIILPVGISFYTFQTLSYTLDVYKGKLKPWPSPLDFALYVTFFPQLVAGPIVRARDFLPQCETPRRATAPQFAWGLTLLVVGLFEKIVVADGFLAPIVEEVYNPLIHPDFISAWLGTLAFAGQIYCDFAGYSTCAIGAGMCLGFALPDNFRAPYAAIGFSDLWRRWHISLSTWLRDYLYIPLGGNRHGTARTYVNLMLTMLIGGLWHGASWTFVLWGGLHGLYLAAERLLKSSPLARLKAWQWPAFRPAAALLTFGLVCFTWVFFRAGSFGQAFQLAGAMLHLGSALGPWRIGKLHALYAAVPTAFILLTHWRMRDTTLEAVAGRMPWWGRSVAIAAMLVIITMMPGEDRAFIYFQF